MVNCREDQILNPLTNRCVKKSGKIGRQLLGQNNVIAPKICPGDKIVNPLTNRCVKKNGPIGNKLMGNVPEQPAPCAPDKIRNPRTGRCVKKSGKTGKGLVAATPPQPRVPTPPRPRLPTPPPNRAADPNYIYNPRLGWFVRRSSQDGKQAIAMIKESNDAKELEWRRLREERDQLARNQEALRKTRDEKGIPNLEVVSSDNILPDNIVRTRGTSAYGRSDADVRTKFGSELFDFIPGGYNLSNLIGRGVWGSVYLLCDRGDYFTNCNLVIKIVKRNPKFYKNAPDFYSRMEREVYMQRIFFKEGLAPQLFMTKKYRFNGDDYFAMVMEKIDGILMNSLTNYPKGHSTDDYCKMVLSGVSGLIQSMCRKNLIHGDLHSENIGIQLWVGDSDDDEDYVPGGDEKYDDQIGVQFMIIDFGWASEGPCRARLEFLQLLRNIVYAYDHKKFKNKTLGKCIVRNLFNEYMSNFDDPNMKLDYNQLSESYTIEFKDYAKNHYFK